MGLKKTPKLLKEESPDQPSSSLKKVSKLPSDEKEQETVKLKPFEKPAKPGTVEPEKDKKDSESRAAYDRSERPQRDEAVKESVSAPMKKSETIAKDTKEPQAAKFKPVAKAPEDEQVKESDKPLTKVKKMPPQEQEKEEVKLKPFSKSPKAEAVKPEKESEKKKEAEKTLHQKPSPPKPVPVKKIEKSPQEEKPTQLKKVELVPKEPEEKDKPLKHEETLKKKVELKKTPSPKVEKPKPKEIEKIIMERKPSAERTKKLPRQVSPKDSFEGVTLKKVPKKISPEEEAPHKTVKEKVPAMKELSPVQLRKISTQLEEEVFEEEPEKELESDNEGWGWELVPRDSSGSTEDWGEEPLEGDARETPGMPGASRGEIMAAETYH
nr:neurofilament heavy polypeptide-like [Salvelinus alpinus]